MEKEFKTRITSEHRLLDLHLRETFQYRDLLFLFVKRDFTALYKQTILGPLWAIIQPLLTTVVFTVIFGSLARLTTADGEGSFILPGFLFYMAGTICWAYFSATLQKTARTFVDNRATMGKVYYPRLVMPLSTVLSKLISFGIQYIFLIIFVAYYALATESVNPNLWILMTPILLLQLALLSMGFGIIISSVTTKYRDLAKLVGFGVQLWMYGTPVAYDMFSMAAFAPGGKWHTLYMCNPVTSLINLFRFGYLGFGEVEWKFYWIGWVSTLVILFFGVVLFSHVEKTFMDTV